MRSAVRFIATLAMVFALVPALHADETAPPPGKATKDKAAAFRIAAKRVAAPQPGTGKALPTPSATSRPSQGPRSASRHIPQMGCVRQVHAEGGVVFGIFFLARDAH